MRLVNRSGIATGEVIVAPARAGGRVLVGDVVQPATRLEQSAPATEGLIAEATYRIVADRITARPVDAVAAGVDGPVPAYRLLWVCAVIRRRFSSG